MCCLYCFELKYYLIHLDKAFSIRGIIIYTINGTIISVSINELIRKCREFRRPDKTRDTKWTVGYKPIQMIIEDLSFGDNFILFYLINHTLQSKHKVYIADIK